jgi:hypothetical protein
MAFSPLLTRTCRVRVLATWVALCAGLAGPLFGQEIPKPDYITYMPGGVPLPGAQHPATALFQLYGDTAAPGYVDRNPQDGIDDRRGEWLTQIAVRFAPWMVRNTIDYPMDWRRFVDHGPAFPLYIDVFDMSQAHPRLARTSTIDFRQLEGRPCQVPAARAANDTTPDCQLLALLNRFGPEVRAAPKPVQPGQSDETVLYFDFPGQDPESWNREFEGPVHGSLASQYIGWAKTFVHPFISDVPGRPATDPRYQLVMQYWFFYPYNDAGNIHEGDWEHINVVVTSKEQGAEPFTADQMRAWLANPPPMDDLVIGEVQYYFHHWVFRLDYWQPNVYLPHDAWEKQRDNLTIDRFGERGIWDQTRKQAYLDDDETRLNLHPVIFIGGDNRGLQQLIASPTRLGRASHGSYPFVALYKDVGPQGTGELVKHPWDLFRSPPDSNAPETEPLVRYDNPGRVELIPDWERILPLVETDAAARQRWAWLVLPIRFGYPATKSPFAGIVKFAETGNLSIPAPPFNTGWNRSGDASGYDVYYPHRLGSAFPASLQDNFQTGWGFFNLTLPTLATLPGFDIIFRLVSLPFKPLQKSSGPAFFISETVPFRFIGVSGGASEFRPSDKWFSLFGFPELFNPLLDEARRLAGSDTVNITSTETDNDRAVQWLAGINLYLGRKFVSESSIRHSNSTLRSSMIVENVPGIIPLTADLDFWEFVGSLRYNLGAESFQPYLKAGYGLSWYRLENAKFGNTVLGDGTSRWVRQPSLFHNLLPNTWHLGAGIEYIPVKSVRGPDFGVKGEAVWFTHSLGVEPASGEFLFIRDERINRLTFSLSGNFSF